MTPHGRSKCGSLLPNGSQPAVWRHDTHSCSSGVELDGRDDVVFDCGVACGALYACFRRDDGGWDAAVVVGTGVTASSAVVAAAAAAPITTLLEVRVWGALLYCECGSVSTSSATQVYTVTTLAHPVICVESGQLVK